MKTSVNASVAAASRLTRVMLVGLAFAVFMLMAMPLYAVSPVNLHGPHVGADSSTFNTEGDTGGLTDPVVWHFVLTGNWDDPDATLYVEFADAGAKSVSGTQAGGGAVHFYVGTPDHDVLLSGYVIVTYTSAPQNPNLVLSHVALNEPPGEEPPGEEPPGEEPPGEEPPGEEPPGEEPPGEEPPVIEEEEPFLPFTEELVEKAEEEEFLPFTGGPITLLIGSAVAALAGAALRRVGR